MAYGQLQPTSPSAHRLALDTHKFRLDSMRFGINLSNKQIEQFKHYYMLLSQWNKRINLTAITDWERVQKVHFLDSIALATKLLTIDFAKCRLIDVGSGAGFPGIPLKIVFPEMEICLLESVGKKVSFLEEALRELGIKETNVYHGRAEDLAHDPSLRESFDIALARGVAKLPVLAEFLLPFVKVNGSAIAYKKGEISKEINESKNSLEILGGMDIKLDWYEIDTVKEYRAFVEMPKYTPTPVNYPRRAGFPAKRPL